MSKHDGSQKAANNVKINKQNDIEIYAISSRGTKMSKKKENCNQSDAVARFAKHQQRNIIYI